MHGTGNRIVVVDNRQLRHPVPSAEQLKRLGSNDSGPGFDQLMWLEPADYAAHKAAYRVFNADGSEAEQCGNGLRCLAWVLGREGPREFDLESPVGIVTARLVDATTTAVGMGKPVFAPGDIPFVADAEAPRYEIDVDGQTLTVDVLSMGNPHAVLDVDDMAMAPVATLGPALQQHPRFPTGVNVGFRQITSRTSMALRVFERGVGETLACGTGACAAVVSGIRSGRLDADVTVALPGGEVMVSWQGDNVWLSGEVAVEMEGSFDL